MLYLCRMVSPALNVRQMINDQLISTYHGSMEVRGSLSKTNSG